MIISKPELRDKIKSNIPLTIKDLDYLIVGLFILGITIFTNLLYIIVKHLLIIIEVIIIAWLIGWLFYTMGKDFINTFLFKGNNKDCNNNNSKIK